MDFNNIKEFVINVLGKDNSGHNHQHVFRVVSNAEKILKHEKGNERIVLTAAYLHDCADEKLFDNQEEQYLKINNLLMNENYTSQEIDEIIYIIKNISYNKGNYATLNSLNAQIVRDADRLDAIGAMGIIRTIEYGVSRGKQFYHTKNIKTVDNKKDINELTDSTLSHFYEKLLKLKDLMHTKTARKMAEKRSAFLETFLQHFYDEL